ncbi:hypothetical protein [Mycolicibacterium obuense]|uniref:Intersectin-EH binding protein Ibp1 n=1 Tax=Mycolicibacterium obuense TaxID=1807 RepID=A0A0M2K8B6_9MYCO|nr:hypothetical protein [Mycolicibacterium obuense]KKF03462.1 hypothetical protein WN67_02665 [Mycolicibacterium obuense]
MARRQRLLGAAMITAALAVPVVALSAAPSAVAQPPGSCPPGQTGVVYGCTPFCLPGKALDLNTGLCMPVAPPPAPAAALAPTSQY